VTGLVIGHETTVDYNGDERDPAWCAFCETGHWHGVWQHADDYSPHAAAVRVPGEWERAQRIAEAAAELDARDHRDIHTND